MKNRRYTEEELDFLRQHAEGRSRTELVGMLKERFGFDVSIRSVGSVMSRNDIHNHRQGFNSQFQKGCIPWNKGTKGLQLGGKKTQFKKGHVPASRKPIGTEVWSEDKQTYYIKIANPDVWVKKKRYLWEQAHGPIPEGHVIICKDNDPRNVTLDNLLCVSHRAMTSVFQRGLRTEYPEINEALHTLAELEMKLKQKK